MAKKKLPEEGAKRAANPNVMGLRPEVLEQPITETLELTGRDVLVPFSAEKGDGKDTVLGLLNDACRQN